ncbi:hypothetical protein [Achromobacter arsenitoxydans]|uniref:Uncharacterized protein n=1 Tax=Achromobacter arsenitoxydans SY8 TaxID=477184 RepID=H0F6H6_9BURK|nr:hypothetical protein [Achromobacter arsenitoxydans]EHK66148.1 hypothetical protein KYC_11858 [Achromobacter arsenitoxydans SY8]
MPSQSDQRFTFDLVGSEAPLDADVERYLALISGNLWLLHSDEARVLLNDLTESPQARLRKLEALARGKESSND